MNRRPNARSRSVRALTYFSTLAVAAVAISGCSATTPDADDDDSCEVYALIVGQMSGAMAAVGNDTVAGSQLAADEINADGGINGCDLVIESVDDGSDPTQDLPLVQAALSSDKKYINVHVSNSYGASSAAPLLTQSGILSMNTTATPGLDDAKAFPYHFTTSSNSIDADAALIRKLVADGHTRLGIVTDNTAVGQANVAVATEIMEAAGGEVVTVEQVEPIGVVNFIPAIQKLQQAGADATYLALYGAEAAAFLRDYRAAGVDAPLYGGQYTAGTDLVSLTSADAVKDVVLVGMASGSLPSRPAMESFIEKVDASGVKPQISSWMLASAYSTMTLMAWAANETGSNDAATIAKFLEENGATEPPGFLLGDATGYDSERHALVGPETIAFVEAGEWDANGLLPRIEFATLD